MVWILAKLPDAIEVTDDDCVDKCLLLTNSHDGEKSVQVKVTPIRVACQNTLTMALWRGSRIRIRHAKDLPERMALSHELPAEIDEKYAALALRYRAMAASKLTGNEGGDYVQRVFPIPGATGAEDRRRAVRRRIETDRQWSLHFYHEGAGNQDCAKETLWAAYNGITEYVDHNGGRRDRRTVADSRLLGSIWQGHGALIKARAYEVVLDVLGPS